MTPPEKTIRRESLVLRVLWMLLFLLVWQIAVPLLGILVVAQLLYRLFYAAPSAHFMNFGDSLSQYLSQIGRFAVFNTDAKPWPFADWPIARVADGEAAHIPKAKVSAAASVVEPAEATDASVSETAQGVEESALKPEPEQVSEVSEVSETQDVPDAKDQSAAAEAQSDEPKV